jgi:hypothetical protein
MCDERLRLGRVVRRVPQYCATSRARSQILTRVDCDVLLIALRLHVGFLWGSWQSSCLLLLLVAQYWDGRLPPRSGIRRRGGRRLNGWSTRWVAKRRLAIRLNARAMHIAVQAIRRIPEVGSECDALV